MPTYPILWSHDATSERTLAFDGDHEGIPRVGSTPIEQALIDEKIAAVWQTASHCHFNRDFRFNSQATSMQFTLRRTLGGRAWLSIQLASPEQEKILVLWANTSLGLLIYWWQANKQQAGRGSIGKKSLQSLPILDVTALTDQQRIDAVSIFDDFQRQLLSPMHEIDQDEVRKRLDEAFLHRVLGVDSGLFAHDGPFDLLRRKLSREPSVRGHKK